MVVVAESGRDQAPVVVKSIVDIFLDDVGARLYRAVLDVQSQIRITLDNLKEVAGRRGLTQHLHAAGVRILLLDQPKRHLRKSFSKPFRGGPKDGKWRQGSSRVEPGRVKEIFSAGT